MGHATRGTARRRRDIAVPFAGALFALLGTVMAIAVGRYESADDLPLRAWTFAWGSIAHDVTLPAHVDRELPHVPVVFHLRTRVVIPESFRARPLTLVLPRIPAPVTLTVDGAPAPSLDASTLLVYRPRGAHAFTLDATQTSKPEVDLDLAITFTWTQAAWIDVTPYLTTSPDGGGRYALLRGFEEVAGAVGALAISTIGFTYAIIFATDRRRRAYGWFAAQALAAGLYPLHVWGPSQLVFGVYDSTALVLALITAITVSHAFIAAQFGAPRASRFWTVALVLAALLVVALGGPYDASLWPARVTVAVVAAGVVRQVVLLARLFVRPNAPSNVGVVFACWIILAGTCWFDLAAWLGLGEIAGGLRGASVGLTAFALLQSVALSRDHATALVDAERLNATLAKQVESLATGQAELDRLNDELRHQVLARAEALSDALARLAGAQGAAVVLREDDLVDGRYAVVRGIGAGGMGVVYEVRRCADDRRFALKVLSGAASVEAMARFAREAKLVATVSAPNVVGVVDAGVAPAGFLYLVMEFVEGAPLSRYRNRMGGLRWATAVLGGVARGLAAVHAQGIVHRDLKPGNVLVREDGAGWPIEVKIADFGISNTELPSGVASKSGADADAATLAAGKGRVVVTPSDARTDRDSMAPALTQTGHMLGTPAYMAPELLRDARNPQISSDIYSLGVLAYELFFGARPFDEIQALARAHGLDADLAAPPPFATVLGASAPTLAALLDAALAVSPDARPTAEAIAAEAARARVPDTARPRPMSSAPPAAGT